MHRGRLGLILLAAALLAAVASSHGRPHVYAQQDNAGRQGKQATTASSKAAGDAAVAGSKQRSSVNAQLRSSKQLAALRTPGHVASSSTRQHQELDSAAWQQSSAPAHGSQRAAWWSLRQLRMLLTNAAQVRMTCMQG